MGVESCSSAKLKIKIQEILSSEKFPLPFPWPLGGISWMYDVYLKSDPPFHHFPHSFSDPREKIKQLVSVYTDVMVEFPVV